MSGPKNKTPQEAPAEEPQTPPEPAGPSQTQQATAAASAAVSAVRERLIGGEQFALVGAALVTAVWLIWDLIFSVGEVESIPGLTIPVVSNFTLLIAVLIILSIWVHRWGHYDFGKAYRIVVGGLGVVLALLAIMDFLITIRTGIDAAPGELLGLLLFWAGGVAALYGGWIVFRTRED